MLQKKQTVQPTFLDSVIRISIAIEVYLQKGIRNKRQQIVIAARRRRWQELGGA